MITRNERLLLGLDLAGIFVFAVEGAMAALGGGFDILGVLVLAFSTGLGGGIIRDLLLGDTPVAAIRDHRYAFTALIGGGVVFLLHGPVAQLPPMLLTVVDALGLALCAVAGAEKALSFGVHPSVAVLLGGISGTGGGVVRDLLMARSPGVLHTDVYATAAIAGALAMVIAQRTGRNATVASIIGVVTCCALRLLAVAFGWQLPRFS